MVEHGAGGIGRRAAAAVAGAAAGFREGLRTTRSTEEPAHTGVLGGARGKLEAVEETIERAEAGPKVVAQEVKDAVKDVAADAGKIVAGVGGALLLLLTAYVVLAIFLVVALNGLLGDPLGTLVAGLFLAAVGAFGLWYAKRAATDAAQEVDEAAQHIEAEADYVTQPVRREFGEGGPT